MYTLLASHQALLQRCMGNCSSTGSSRPWLFATLLWHLYNPQ